MEAGFMVLNFDCMISRPTSNPEVIAGSGIKAELVAEHVPIKPVLEEKLVSSDGVYSCFMVRQEIVGDKNDVRLSEQACDLSKVSLVQNQTYPAGQREMKEEEIIWFWAKKQ